MTKPVLLTKYVCQILHPVHQTVLNKLFYQLLRNMKKYLNRSILLLIIIIGDIKYKLYTHTSYEYFKRMPQM